MGLQRSVHVTQCVFSLRERTEIEGVGRSYLRVGVGRERGEEKEEEDGEGGRGRRLKGWADHI